MRYFIELAYNGTGYSGWQFQVNTPVTIQAELKAGLERLLRCSISLTGCGRTDAGVHAEEFFAHFNHEGPIDNVPFLVFRLNRLLSPNIYIKRVFQVIDNAHARFDATSRTYQYRLITNKTPFFNQVITEWHYPLQLDLMNEAAQMLLGTRDFGSFCKSRSANKTNICTVTEARWKRDGDVYTFTITANRFLRNMVRAVVGTHLEMARDRMTMHDYIEVLNNSDRSLAGISAPPQGLFLTSVKYDWDMIILPTP